MIRLALLLCCLAGHPGFAEDYRSIQDRRPDLFHPETGFRIARQRAPTPEDIPPPNPGARRDSTKAMQV